MIIWLIFFVVGFGLGVGLGYWLVTRSQSTVDATTDVFRELLRQEEEKAAERQRAMLESLKDKFGELSLQSMAKTSEQLVQLNQRELESHQKQGKK